MERRKSPRFRWRIGCEIQRATGGLRGNVLDVSAGGLCIQTDEELEHGETLTVRMSAPGQRRPVEVEAIVWHARRARRRDRGTTCFVHGLMLSKASPEYEVLLPTGGPPAPRAAEPAAPAEQPAAPTEPPPPGLTATEPEPPPPLSAFHVRVKALESPRTRVLTLQAESEDRARETAQSDLGSEWEILEIAPA